MNFNKVYSLYTLAYKDYVASRVLLNKRYVIQGAQLAATSIEKYLKVIPASKGRWPKMHLDKVDKFKELYQELQEPLINYLDPNFLQILSSIYKIRYYDEIDKPLSIGFFIKQLLGELDYTVNWFEKLSIIKRLDTGEVVKTQYLKSLERKDEDLYFNNFVLNGIPKKEYMESPDDGYGLYIDNTILGSELELKGRGVKNKYNGKITIISINPPNVE